MGVYPLLNPIRNEEMLKRVMDAAHEDGHPLLFPTHVVMGGESILGAVSICNTPLLNFWMRKDCKARETAYTHAACETIAKTLGHTSLVMPCTESSPLYPYIERLGYINLGKTTLNLKQDLYVLR